MNLIEACNHYCQNKSCQGESLTENSKPLAQQTLNQGSRELSWFYLVLINIQLEKNKVVQRRQGIEGTRKLSCRCPSAVKLVLLVSSFNLWWCIWYMWEGLKELLDDQHSCAGVLKVLKKYWISKLVFKTLKKYWILPKCTLGIGVISCQVTQWAKPYPFRI